MHTRLLPTPTRPIFLFGPRGTGKSTWIRDRFKASPRWEKRFNRGLHRVSDDLGKDRTTCLGVYLGQRRALWDDVQVLPMVDFLKRLWAGEIIRVP